MICIDLDCTLIDSERRYDDEREIAEGYGINEREYKETVDELCRTQGVFAYTFERMYELLLQRRPGLPKKIVEDLQKLLDKNYLFPDSCVFLDSFLPKDLAIIATGSTHFQWRKITANNLVGRAHLFWITEHKDKVGAVAGIVLSAACMGIKKRVFFIDDAPREIKAVKKAFPEIICIQVRTPASWETQRSTEFYDVYFPAGLLPARDFIKSMLKASQKAK